MSKKHDVRAIFWDHIGTLKDLDSSSYNFADVFVQYIFPALIAVFFWFFCPVLGSEVGMKIDQTIIASFAVFTALLFNLQVLIIGMISDDKAISPIDESEEATLRKNRYVLKKSFIKQIFYNVSYAILLSILLVAFSIVLVFFGFTENMIPKVIQVYIVSHFLFVSFMVLKRTHALFSQV